MASLAIAAVGLGLGAAGTTVSVIGNRKADKAARDAAKKAQEQADANAKEMETAAREVEVLGREQAIDAEVSSDQIISQQRAAAASGGMMVGVGSLSDVEDQTRVAAIEAGRRITLNAAQEARGLRRRADLTRQAGAVVASQYQNQAAQYRLQMAGTALSGASNLALQAYKL